MVHIMGTLTVGPLIAGPWDPFDEECSLAIVPAIALIPAFPVWRCCGDKLPLEHPFGDTMCLVGSGYDVLGRGGLDKSPSAMRLVHAYSP
jgi:hypothetical protein